MKTIFLALVLVVASIVGAQEKIDSYKSEFTGETYDILFALDENQKHFTLYVDLFSLDKYTPTGGIFMSNSSNERFYKALTDAKKKYAEWIAVAKENNVTQVSKDMDTECTVAGYFYYGDKWRFQWRLDIDFRFKITEGAKEYLLIINTGKITSSENEYIDHKGFALVFTSPEEVDEFLAKISPEKMSQSVEKFKDKKSVFK